MAGRNTDERRPLRRTPPSPPPRRRYDVPAGDDDAYEDVSNYNMEFEELYENIPPLSGSFSEFDNDTFICQRTDTDRNKTSTEVEDYLVSIEEFSQDDFSSDDDQPQSPGETPYDTPRLTSNDPTTKKDQFNRSPSEFVRAFDSTLDEKRTNEETFIIVDLLKKNESNSPILDGDLEQLALLACCSSPHVVKRALDALLNEIFLSISNFRRIRCRNILEAEEIIRESFDKFLNVEHLNAKCQRMTTYAWLITFVLLKCSKDECVKLATDIRKFDRILEALLRESNEENTFRYGIVLARESIKRVTLFCARRDPTKSLHRSLEQCANILNSKLEKKEIMKFGKALDDEESWLNLHLCLVFLQDLPKLHQFQGNLKPIFLIQIMIKDYRERRSSSRSRSSSRGSTSKLKNALRIQPNLESWKFEILVYHVMRRLIRTPNDDVITEVLMGKVGCGGIFISWSEKKLSSTEDLLVIENLEKLCERIVFRAPPICVEWLVTQNCQGNVQDFIENLSILWLSSIYKDKVLDVLPKSDARWEKQRVSTYDAVMNGRKCELKLYRHTKEEILKANTSGTDSLQKEIEIVKVLNALADSSQNIVQLLGSSIEAPMHMIMERGSKGDLLTCLKKHLNSTETQILVQIAQDICKALMFLQTQNILHRDVQAKNCFVFMQDGKLLAKLGGFHLSVLAYSGQRSPTSTKQQPHSIVSTINKDFFYQFAVPWMAVETLQFREFSTASDVWSYGVLLFEIFTLGSQPYINMPNGLSLKSDEDVREYVTSGNRLDLHPKIPESIQVIIQSTMVDADHRPTFSHLKDNLSGMKFADETYVDSSYFQISHDSGNPLANIISQPISASTGCTANGCSGECFNTSDVAVPLNIDGNHFMKEFVPASSRDILKLSELECPSLAIITQQIFHHEKLELITELGDFGSLTQSIKLHGCSNVIAMRYLSQIGEGVSFLHNRRFIHRNLRANSVTVYSDGNAKLACFSRVRKLKPNDDDQSSTIPINLPMPDDSLRWSSPEVITDGEYSKASDMWAFGVLIWEMFALIDKDLDESDKEISPYHQFSSKEQILSCLQRNNRLGKPESCPDWLYEIMLWCWMFDTQDRAKAQDIVQSFNDTIPNQS
mgnify:FL=1